MRITKQQAHSCQIVFGIFCPSCVLIYHPISQNKEWGHEDAVWHIHVVYPICHHNNNVGHLHEYILCSSRVAEARQVRWQLRSCQKSCKIFLAQKLSGARCQALKKQFAGHFGQHEYCAVVILHKSLGSLSSD